MLKPPSLPDRAVSEVESTQFLGLKKGWKVVAAEVWMSTTTVFPHWNDLSGCDFGLYGWRDLLKRHFR